MYAVRTYPLVEAEAYHRRRGSQARNPCTYYLMLTEQAGVWLNYRYPTCTTDLPS